MGFREDLDLSEIADQYEAFGGRRIREKVYAEWDERGNVPSYAYEPAPEPGAGDDPAKVGIGPLRCSTSRVVATARPAWAWDSNWYYRSLGVPWPYVNATRGDLRRAYFLSNGQDSVWKTYCFKQLLNPDIRDEYDRLPLGERLFDLYSEEEIREEAIRKAHERCMSGEYTTSEEMLDHMGYRLVTDEQAAQTPKVPTSGVSVDTDYLNRFDDHALPEIVGGPWQYAFYLWRTTFRDRHRLAIWQQVLVAELDLLDIRQPLAVGLMGKQASRFAIAETVDGTVVFLNDEVEPTTEVAAAAARTLDRITRAKEPRALTENH